MLAENSDGDRENDRNEKFETLNCMSNSPDTDVSRFNYRTFTYSEKQIRQKSNKTKDIFSADRNRLLFAYLDMFRIITGMFFCC